MEGIANWFVGLYNGIANWFVGLYNGIANWAVEVWNGFYVTVIAEERYWYYLEGLVNTLVIAFFAILLGVCIGVMVAIAKYSAARNRRLRWLGWLAGFYTTVIRGTPVIVQLLILYNWLFTARGSSPILCAVVAFGINSGAYVAEIILAGIESIYKGHMEAGRSLGLTNAATIRLIILPQAIKNNLPALGNEFIVLVKETSVAGMIAVTDLTKAAQYIGGSVFRIMPPLLLAAAVYLILVIILTKLISKLERRLAQSDNR